MKALFIIFVNAVLITQCTTPNYKVQQIDTDLDSKGYVGSSVVGITNDKKAIVQETKRAETMLMELQFKNTRLKKQVDITYNNLVKCYLEVSKSKLKGDSKFPNLPKIGEFEEKNKSSQTTGINKNGRLVVVSKQAFSEAIEDEEEKYKYYTNILKIIEDEKRQCNFDLEEKKYHAGLSTKKPKIKGSFDSKGNWIPKNKTS